MYRTRTCGDLRLADEGLVVTLAGWVQKTRKMGGMTFAKRQISWAVNS